MPTDEVRTLRTDAGRVLYLAAHEDWLRENGYLVPEGPADGGPRHIFYRTPHRENAYRDDGPGGSRLYDKRLRRMSVGDILEMSFSARRITTPVEQEWHMLRLAREAGLAVPRPWAFGEVRRGPLPGASFLLMEELPGQSLHDLARKGPVPRDQALTLARAVAAEVARFHAAGLRFPGLFAKHVYVVGAKPGGEPAIGFLDLASVSHHRRLSTKQRARDLAALAASVPRWAVSRGIRWVFLRDYLAHAGIGWRPRVAWATIDQSVQQLYRHRLRRSVACARMDPDGDTPYADPATQIAVSQTDPVAQHRSAIEAESWPLGGWRDFGPLSVRRGTQYETRVLWSAFRLMRQYGAAGAMPAAIHLAGQNSWLAVARSVEPAAPALPLQAATLDTIAETRLGDILVALLAAGLVPGPHFAAHLHLVEPGRFVLDHLAPIHVPRRVHTWNALRAARRMVAALKRAGVPAAACRRLRHRIVQDGIAAALGRLSEAGPRAP